MWRRCQARWVKRPHLLPKTGNPETAPQILGNMKINVQRPATTQLHAMPSPSGKSLGVHDRGLPAHLVTQVSRCHAWPHKGIQGELQWTTPWLGGPGVSSRCTYKNVCNIDNIMIVKAIRSVELTPAPLYSAAGNIICVISDCRSTLHLNEPDVFYIQSVGASNITITINRLFNYQFEQG